MVNKLYTLDTWKLLNLSIRADLIPVAEGVKKGTQIGFKGYEQDERLNQSELLKRWLEKSSLAYKQHDLDYYACRDESLLDKLWKDEIGIDDFLGYPKCCVKNHRDFSEKFTKYLNDKIGLKELPLPQGMIIGREMVKAVEKGKYDPAISYVIHMPCSIYCKESIEFGRKIKNCLEKNDLEVAEYLKKCSEDNWLRLGKVWTEETWHKFAEERKKCVKSLKGYN